MQRLFNMGRISNPGSQTVAGWVYTKHSLQTNLEKVINYYRLNPTAVDASHILNRIISTLAFGNAYAPEVYERLLDASIPQYAGALGLTSSASKGVLHTGEFFGKNCREIIVAHNESNYDLKDVCENWQDVAAVTVLHHPFTDLQLNIPDGRKESAEFGLCVIAINFNLLGLQYKMFKEHEERLARETGKVKRTMQQFIRSYVMPNMLPSILDYTIFNRLHTNFLGRICNKVRNPHPFQLIDIGRTLDQVQTLQLKMITNSSYRFLEILNTIPAVSKPSLLEVSELPRMAATRQVAWALVPARLKMLSFLMQVSGPVGRALNVSDIERILIMFREFNTSRVLKSSLPLDLYFDSAEELEKIIAPGS